MASALSTNEVTAIFEAVLLRAPTPAEIALYGGQLDEDLATLPEITNDIVTSPEAQNVVDPIVRMYQAVFGHAPDGGGLAFWVNGEDNLGVSLITISQNFVESIEFAAVYGSNVIPDNLTAETAFINALYENILGRPADPGGLSFWLSGLTAGGTAAPTIASEAAVLLGFIQSQEFINDTQASINLFLTNAADSALAQTTATTVGTPTYLSMLPTVALSVTDDVGGVLQPSGATTGGAAAEGSAITFTVTDLTAIPGSTVEYALSGSAAGQVSGPLTGSVVIGANDEATFTVNTLATVLSPAANPAAAESLVVTLVGQTTTPTDTVTINESAVQTITPTGGSVNEGTTIDFIVATTGVPGSSVAGTVESYTVSGGTGQIANGARSGTVTLDSNGGAVVALAIAGEVYNSAATSPVTITLANGTTATETIAETSTQQVIDNVGGTNNPATYATAGGTTTQGHSITFTVNTLVNGVTPTGGAVAGEVETYTLSGTAVTSGQVTSPTSGSVTLDANGEAVVTVNTAANQFTTASDTLVFTLNLPSGSTSPTDTVTINNGTALVTDNNPNATGTTPHVINEGQAVVFTLSTATVPAGTIENWTLTGAGASQVSGPTAGAVTVNSSGVATVTVDTEADIFNTPGTNPLTISFVGLATASDTVTLNENATIAVSNPAAVNEGSAVVFTITGSSYVAPGTVESYTLSGAGAAQVNGSLTGTVVVGPGPTTVSVNTFNNVIDSSLPPQALTLTLNGVTGASGTGTIVENASLTVLPSPNPETVNEGSPVVFALTGVNLPTGTSIGYQLSGNGTSNVLGPLTGTAVVNPNGTVDLSVATGANDFNDTVTPTKTLTMTLIGLTTPAASATITEDSTLTVATPAPVDEGGQLVFTINTTNVPAGTQESFTLSGAGTSQVTSPLTGTVTIGAGGTGTVVVNTTNNVIDAPGGPTTTAAVTLTLNGLAGPPPNATGQIVENSTLTVAGVPNNTEYVSEGSPLYFNLAGTNLPLNTSIGYTLTGDTANIAAALQTGTVVVNSNGVVQLTIPTLANDINDPTATQEVILTLDGLSTPAATAFIDENSVLNIHDNGSVSEGQQVTFTITGSNVPVGTEEAYTLTGTAAALGQITSPLTGIITIGLGDVATLVVQTIALPDSNPTAGLTLTLNGVPGASDTATILENAPPAYILTTKVDDIVLLGDNNLVYGTFNGFGATFTPGDQIVGTLGSTGNTLTLGDLDGAAESLTNNATNIAATVSNVQILNINSDELVDANTAASVAGFSGLLQLNVNENNSGSGTDSYITAAGTTNISVTDDGLGPTAGDFVYGGANIAVTVTNTGSGGTIWIGDSTPDSFTPTVSTGSVTVTDNIAGTGADSIYVFGGVGNVSTPAVSITVTGDSMTNIYVGGMAPGFPIDQPNGNVTIDETTSGEGVPPLPGLPPGIIWVFGGANTAVVSVTQVLAAPLDSTSSVAIHDYNFVNDLPGSLATVILNGLGVPTGQANFIFDNSLSALTVENAVASGSVSVSILSDTGVHTQTLGLTLNNDTESGPGFFGIDDVAGLYGTINITMGALPSAGAISAPDATTLTIAGSSALTLMGSALPDVTTITISGAAGLVDLYDFVGPSSLTLVTDTSSGSVALGLNDTQTTFAGGTATGPEIITISEDATKFITGDGNPENEIVFNSGATTFTVPDTGSHVTGFNVLGVGPSGDGTFNLATSPFFYTGGIDDQGSIAGPVIFTNVKAGTSLAIDAANSAGDVSYYLSDFNGANDSVNVTLGVNTARAALLGLPVTTTGFTVAPILTLEDASESNGIGTVSFSIYNATADQEETVTMLVDDQLGTLTIAGTGELTITDGFSDNAASLSVTDNGTGTAGLDFVGGITDDSLTTLALAGSNTALMELTSLSDTETSLTVTDSYAGNADIGTLTAASAATESFTNTGTGTLSVGEDGNVATALTSLTLKGAVAYTATGMASTASITVGDGGGAQDNANVSLTLTGATGGSSTVSITLGDGVDSITLGPGKGSSQQTVILGNGAGDHVSSTSVGNVTVDMGSGVGDTVVLGAGVGGSTQLVGDITGSFSGSFDSVTSSSLGTVTITLGNGFDDSVSLTGGATSHTETITLGDGNLDSVASNSAGAATVDITLGSLALGTGQDSVTLSGAMVKANITVYAHTGAESISVAENGTNTIVTANPPDITMITGLNNAITSTDSITFLSDSSALSGLTHVTAAMATGDTHGTGTNNAFNYIVAAEDTTGDGGAGLSAHGVAWFNAGGNTYILESVAGSSNDGTFATADTVVELVGVTYTFSNPSGELGIGVFHLLG